jgi:hypothetical protein
VIFCVQLKRLMQFFARVSGVFFDPVLLWMNCTAKSQRHGIANRLLQEAQAPATASTVTTAISRAWFISLLPRQQPPSHMYM